VMQVTASPLGARVSPSKKQVGSLDSMPQRLQR